MTNDGVLKERIPTLERPLLTASHTFAIPAKKINDGNDLNHFFSSKAYRDITIWLLQLNRSMFAVKGDDGTVQSCNLTSPPTYSATVTGLRVILNTLSTLLEKAPPNTGPRRFGNVAFRDWYGLAEQETPDLLRHHLSEKVAEYGERSDDLVKELQAYLLGSFGSAQRLDYGTGHELSFLAFLGCLWKLGAFPDKSERSIVIGVIQPYLELVRKLISTYTLEPAGSHGVWGLDDHSFLPYIFGSAQLGPAIDPISTTPVPTEGSLPNTPAPSSVTRRDIVADYKDGNMYFSAIQFIYDVKKGPFWEHSPILFDISGIKDGWAKINKGMLKMYAAEVLGKFPVVQHFPFGSLLSWELDPGAVAKGRSVHVQQQPRAGTQAPAPAGGRGDGVGTAAPWAKPTAAKREVAMPQMQASTGVPTARAGPAGRPQAATTAPWTATQQPSPTNAPAMIPTAAPWASTQRTAAPSGGRLPTTVAPWAKKDGEL